MRFFTQEDVERASGRFSRLSKTKHPFFKLLSQGRSIGINECVYISPNEVWLISRTNPIRELAYELIRLHEESK